MKFLVHLCCVVTACSLGFSCEAVFSRLRKNSSPKIEKLKKFKRLSRTISPLYIKDFDVSLITGVTVKRSFLTGVHNILCDYQQNYKLLFSTILAASCSKKKNEQKILFNYFASLNLDRNNKRLHKELLCTIRACIRTNKNSELEVISRASEAIKE